MKIPLCLLCAAMMVAAQAPTSDSRNTVIPDTDTHFTMPGYTSLAQWEARKSQLRRQILFSAGLDPMPARTPLHAEVFGRIEHADYTVEKLLLETMPGYWLGGNLYRPKGRTGKLPAIASPHGHWSYGRLENQQLVSVPGRCINLARQGYVVVSYDMVGYDDTTQTSHDFAGRREQLWGFGPLGLQLWNSIRVVDFLISLPEVDPERIGATGASGGGTQVLMLAATDDRVKFAAPVNMVSAIMQGGSPCENAPGLRVGTFNVELAATIAPRPLLLVSATGDWTRNTLTEEFPAIRKIYALYGKGNDVETVQFDFPHNYNQTSREAVYRFFAKRMLEDPNWASYKERPPTIEKLQDMLALYGRTRPEGALTYDQIFAQWRERAAAQVEAIRDPAELRRLLAQAIGAVWPDQVVRQTDGEHIVLSRPAVGDRIPGIWLPGSGKPVLVVSDAGAESARNTAAVRDLVAANRPVLLVDAFQTGSAAAPRDRSKSHFLTFNRSDDALRVQDILTALRWLETTTSAQPELIGLGNGAIWARFAAAIAPKPVTLQAGTDGFQGTDAELEARFFVPGIQRAGGWKTALALTMQ